jgi:hypothetical protein
MLDTDAPWARFLFTAEPNFPTSLQEVIGTTE